MRRLKPDKPKKEWDRLYEKACELPPHLSRKKTEAHLRGVSSNRSLIEKILRFWEWGRVK